MGERTNPIQQDLRDIYTTRTGMGEKLEQLEARVQETVGEAKSTMFDVVGKVRDAGEEFLDRAETFVEHTKQNFDPTFQIQQHPWMMIGGAIVAGYVLGVLESRQASSLAAQKRLPYYAGSGESGRTSSGRAAGGRDPWGGIVEQVHDEIDRTKGALLQVGRSLIRDLFQQILPTLVEPVGGRRRQVRRPPTASYDPSQKEWI